MYGSGAVTGIIVLTRPVSCAAVAGAAMATGASRAVVTAIRLISATTSTASASL